MSARPVTAPRGTAMTCKAWPQEAALRMLMNNLDPEVAGYPAAERMADGCGLRVPIPPAPAP